MVVATASWQDVWLNWQKSSKSAPKHAMELVSRHRTRWCFNVVSRLCGVSCSWKFCCLFGAGIIIDIVAPIAGLLALRPFPENMR